jgi:hypothetical protein
VGQQSVVVAGVPAGDYIKAITFINEVARGRSGRSPPYSDIRWKKVTWALPTTPRVV